MPSWLIVIVLAVSVATAAPLATNHPTVDYLEHQKAGFIRAVPFTHAPSGMAECNDSYREPRRSPVPLISAPWTLKAKTYVLFLKLDKLPERVYDTIEEKWEDNELGHFVGGLGTIMIVRYSDTPSGSYDELLLIPGAFTVPQAPEGSLNIPKKARRVCRIYVSQRTTAYNGRLNWNIPKHLARFSFYEHATPKNASSPVPLTVKVFPPGTCKGDNVPPFFACTLTPWSWVPAVPVNTRWLPSIVFVQPPLPKALGHHAAVEEALLGPEIDKYDLDPQKEAALNVGTDGWCSFDVTAEVSRARGCWVKYPTKDKSKNVGYEGNTWFPSGLQPWRVGGWFEEVAWTIQEPIRWELEETTSHENDERQSNL